MALHTRARVIRAVIGAVIGDRWRDHTLERHHDVFRMALDDVCLGGCSGRVDMGGPMGARVSQRISGRIWSRWPP